MEMDAAGFENCQAAVLFRIHHALLFGVCLVVCQSVARPLICEALELFDVDRHRRVQVAQVFLNAEYLLHHCKLEAEDRRARSGHRDDHKPIAPELRCELVCHVTE